jgi:hypothetical protein
VYAPKPARPQNIPPSTTDSSHRALRAPSPSGLAKGHIGASPPHGHSVHGFRPPSAQASPAFPRPSPHLSIWAGGVSWNKRVWISKWTPPLMRSLLSSSHVIKRASLTVSPGIPIIIANQCSGVHHLCGVVTIRASTSSPCTGPRPHNHVPSSTRRVPLWRAWPECLALADGCLGGQPTQIHHYNGRGIPACSFLRGGMLG